LGSYRLFTDCGSGLLTISPPLQSAPEAVGQAQRTCLVLTLAA